MDYYGGYRATAVYLGFDKVIYFKITPDSIDDNPSIHTMVDDMNEELVRQGYRPTITLEVWETEEEITSRSELDAYTGLRSIVGVYS